MIEKRLSRGSKLTDYQPPLPKRITAEIISEIFQPNCRLYSGFANQTHELTPKTHYPLTKYVFHLGSHLRFDAIPFLLLGG